MVLPGQNERSIKISWNSFEKKKKENDLEAFYVILEIIVIVNNKRLLQFVT